MGLRSERLAARRKRIRTWIGAISAATAVLLVGLGAYQGGGAALVESSRTPSPSPSVSPSPRPTPSKDPNRRERAVTIVAVGDTMFGLNGASAPRGYLSDISRSLEGDVVFANLEGVLGSRGSSKCSDAGAAKPGIAAAGTPGCYAFRAPPTEAKTLAGAGFNVVSEANNHSLDFGAKGLGQSGDALDSAGIEQTGLRGEVAVIRSNGVSVAVLGFAPYSWTSNLLNIPAAQAALRDAARRFDVVLAYMHAGAEGSDRTHVTGREEFFAGEDRGNPEAFAHAAIDAGADLVIGSGPHVLRGMEFYEGRLIAYSLGNFAGYGNFSLGGALSLGGVLRVRLNAAGHIAWARLVPVRLEGYGRPVRDPSGAAIRLVASVSRQDFGGSAARISPSGRIRA